MSSNKKQMGDVRDILFAQLDRLTDPNCNLEKEIMRTEAITDVTKEIINSAKVEVDFMRVTGGVTSGFVGQIPGQKQIGDGTAGN